MGKNTQRQFFIDGLFKKRSQILNSVMFEKKDKNALAKSNKITSFSYSQIKGMEIC